MLKKFFGPVRKGPHAPTAAPDGLANVKIGSWLFDPAAQTLRRGDRTIRLEHRASRLLALLAARSGEVVSRDEILQAIWNGRSLSDNSVAVVVSDLRRALGDDARAPSFIETVPKRGYRMPGERISRPSPVANPPASTAAKRTSRKVAAMAAFVLVLMATAVAATWPFEAPREPAIVTINDVRNETGLEAYDALASAVTGIGTNFLAGAAPILVRDRWDFDAEDPSRGLYEDFGARAAVYHISSTIVMDGRTARLIMVANDPRTNRVIWSSDANVSGLDTSVVVHSSLEDFLREAGIADRSP